MGQGPRTQERLVAATLAALAVAAVPRSAAADPIVELPPPGVVVARAGQGGRPLVGLLGSISGAGVLGADAMATLPELGGLGEPALLARARVGLLGVHAVLPLAVLVRVNLAEATRLPDGAFDDEPAAAVDRLVNDAAIWWRPAVWANTVVGRQKVPFSRFRQVDADLLEAGVVPFLVNRVAPDRRWGLTTLGDLGALAYAAGAFADTDDLEPRAADDPSSGGIALLAAHVESTPRAPMGRDFLATPTTDPWWGTARVSVGLGALYRVRYGADRLDLSLSTQLVYQNWSVAGELLVGTGGGTATLGVTGEGSVLVTDEVALFTRGERDPEAGRWSAGGGAAFFVTRDRRNKVSLYGWLRRATEGAADTLRGDGLILQLQASL